jgi:hypothetical protein
MRPFLIAITLALGALVDAALSRGGAYLVRTTSKAKNAKERV